MDLKTKIFFRSLLSISSNAVLIVFFVLFLFTTLARLDIVSVFGGAIVYSGSMEPSIHRLDMVVWVNRNYSVGDVLVYCLNPSFCVVHRFVGFCPGSSPGCIVTKGDANPVPDPPISRSLVKGSTAFVVPRYVWMPLFLFSAGYALYTVSRARVVGVSSALVYATIILFIMSVYVFVQPVPGYTNVGLPSLYLSNIFFEPKTCRLVVGYVGDLWIDNATVFANGAAIPALYNSSHVIAYLPPDLAGAAYESSGYINISVVAGLSGVGKLYGNYRVRVYGEPIEVFAENGSLRIRNPNCFPIHINISFQYAYRVGDQWRYTNTATVTLGGFEEIDVEPPSGSRFAYADISYVVWGEKRWQKLVVRYG